jgi:hypothetical protein
MTSEIDLPRSGANASPFLTTKEAAKFLYLSHRTLKDWRLRGGGPSFRKWRRSVRYTMADLIAFADQGVHRTTRWPREIG